MTHWKTADVVALLDDPRWTIVMTKLGAVINVAPLV